MRPSVLPWVLVLALASGCLGRRHGGGGDDDDDFRGDDDADSSDGTGDGPVEEEMCAGYDPLPSVVEAQLLGTYWPDGIESVDATGLVRLTLTPGEWEYEVEGTMDVSDTGTRPLATCEDGAGSAACYGGISVTFCNGDGYFSFDTSSGAGSWSYYDSTTSAFGSGEVLPME